VNGPDRQTVSTSEGDISARLVVLAGGMSDLLRSRLGIERRVIHPRQSITFGFDVAAPDNRHPALTFYGRRPADGIDYLTLFPAAGALRANLFTFLDHRHPWIKEVRQNPEAALDAALPDLAKTIGPFTVPGKMHTWVMDIAVAENPVRDGVVLIGDAFQTSCPAAGTGVSRLLTDVIQLCHVHIPQWLATPGMGTEKIARFYADPEKVAMDTRALGLADYRRNLTVDTGLAWRARRQAMYVRRRTLDAIDRVSPQLRTLLRTTRNRFA
jgi:2-polyprenyl-6-methoxyphenol hydroxylase-like FAD-dependent oxidoreductase